MNIFPSLRSRTECSILFVRLRRPPHSPLGTRLPRFTQNVYNLTEKLIDIKESAQIERINLHYESVVSSYAVRTAAGGQLLTAGLTPSRTADGVWRFRFNYLIDNVGRYLCFNRFHILANTSKRTRKINDTKYDKVSCQPSLRVLI